MILKKLFCILYFSLPFYIYSQTASISGTIIDSDQSPFPGVEVTLIKGNDIIGPTQTDLNGNYVLKNIDYGKYEIKFHFRTMTENIIANFEIKDEKTVFNYIYPAPCKPSKQFCPNGHKNNIIPIVYGFPSKKMMPRANKNKIKLGGCDSTNCENWHCKIHDLDF